jgi:hypothetical protein
MQRQNLMPDTRPIILKKSMIEKVNPNQIKMPTAGSIFRARQNISVTQKRSSVLNPLTVQQKEVLIQNITG